MKLARALLFVALLIAAPTAYGRPIVISPAGVFTGSLKPVGGEATFTVNGKMQVPGRTLPAGTYKIRVVDHLSDRMIVQVERDGKAQTTFLALPKSSLSKNGQGPIFLDSGSKNAMRAFVFADGRVAEFVYPKAEAVGLAKAHNTTIPAVDPASEGRPNTSMLSKEDMQAVTLWLLTPTLVGPDSSPGITAAKYQTPAGSTSKDGTGGAGQQVAQSSAPARPRARLAIAALPHTASQMPLVLFGGVLALGAAGLLRRRHVA